MAKAPQGTRGSSNTSPGVSQPTNPSLIGQLGVNLNLSLPNQQARQGIVQNAQPMLQRIYSNTITNPTSFTGQFQVKPQNVGLIKGFWVKCIATIVIPTGTATLTPYGLANLLSGVTFIDFSNNQRIQNIPGWLLNSLNTVKTHGVFGAALTSDTDTSVQYGSNFSPISGVSTISSATPVTVQMWYYVPLAYRWDDLRGAIYANTINGVLQLNLQVNPNAILGAGGDPALAVYTGAAGSITSFTCQVWQDYYDQLPQDQNGNIILPANDLNQAYLLNMVPYTSVVQGTDFPIPYANYRKFMSTFIYIDNGGTLSDGSDLNYFSLTSANYTNLWNIPPDLAALITRGIIKDDMPLGSYYFDSRRRPLYTANYGNINLNLNFSTVNSGCSVYVGYEQLAQLNMISGASSLGGN